MGARIVRIIILNRKNSNGSWETTCRNKYEGVGYTNEQRPVLRTNCTILRWLYTYWNNYNTEKKKKTLNERKRL